MPKKNAPKKITASIIVDLLAQKHSGDVFVAECKDGPSQACTHLRMDAWAMKRSWAHPCVSAYEVKISRSDFLNDEKWRQYLPYCNTFSFVAPSGIIKPEELPADTGLLTVATTGSRLFTKRKAPFRDVQIPEDVWRYILMCRVAIRRTADNQWGVESPREFWSRFLDGRTQDHELGRKVGRKVRKVLSEQVDEVRFENKRLKREVENLKGIKEMLAELGFDCTHGVPDKWTAKRRVAKTLAPALDERLLEDIENAERYLGRIKKCLVKG